MFVVFLAHLGRSADSEAPHVATLLRMTDYEARLALASPAPAIVIHAAERDRASECVAALRGRGHGAHAFDDELLVPSAAPARTPTPAAARVGAARLTGSQRGGRTR